MENNLLNNLELSGLTKGESKVYYGLLRLGECKTGKLSEYTKIPTSNMYPMLEVLIKKGIISYKLVNNIKVYYPNHPETLNALFNEKQEQLEKNKILLQESIKTLEQMPKLQENFSNYKYFKGVTGIKAMWFEIIEKMKNDEYIDLIASNEKMIEPFEKIFIEIHKTRVEKNIGQKIIFPKGTTNIAQTRKNLGLVEIRELDINNDAEIAILPNAIIINYLGLSDGGPRAIYIEDKIFRNLFKMIFDIIWNLSII